MTWQHTSKDWDFHQTKQRPPKLFQNKWLLILPSGLIGTGPKYSWDGATAAPDFKWVIRASKFHDAIYQFAEDIAAEWGWSVRQVLRFADRVFREVMIEENAPTWGIYTYYYAVRIAGYPFHQFMRFF